jgi:hypothetical protein
MNLYKYHKDPSILDGYHKLDSEILDLGNGIKIPSARYEDEVYGTRLQYKVKYFSDNLNQKLSIPTVRQLQYIYLNKHKLFGVVSSKGDVFTFHDDMYWTDAVDKDDPEYTYIDTVDMQSGKPDYDTDHYTHWFRPILVD